MLLGQVRGEHDGQPVELGRRQERCLLGLLLIETGRTIPAGRLADLLWDGCPPAGARRVIQTYVARLRGRLAACDIQITTGSGGYRTEVPPADVDLHRFRSAVTQAQQITDPARRAASLAAALDLWQGPVLGDTGSDFLRERVGAPFEEIRLAAIEQCARAHLDDGQPDRAIVAIAQAPDRPVREQLIGLRMTALAVAGRKAEALAAYRSARTALVADLGLEPGPELRLLHDQILRGAGAGKHSDHDQAPRSGRPGTLPGEATSVPHELPPAVTVFTGRSEQRRLMAQALAGASGVPADQARVVVIYGMGGVGKSALAVQVAHDVAARFPDGQIYIDLCGSTPGLRPRTAVAALRHCLRSLGVQAADMPRHPAEAAARLRSLMTGRRILFVLDNATSAATIQPLLPASGGCAVIVTVRAMLATLDFSEQVLLEGLSQDEARRLMMAITGPAAGPPGVLDRIIESCERLPLALRIAASRLASRTGLTAQRLADRLADERSRLDELDIDGLAVRTSMRVSLDALRDSQDAADHLAASLLPWLVVVPVPTFTAEFAADAAGLDGVDAVRAAMGRLADLHLVHEAGGQRYGLHDLIRLFAIEEKDSVLSGDERACGSGRALDHYLAISEQICAILMPGRKKPSRPVEPLAGALAFGPDSAAGASGWLDAEIANVVAAAEFALTLPGEQAMFGFHVMHMLHWLLGKRAAWMQELALARLADKAAAAHGNPAQRMDALRMLGQAEWHVGRLAEANEHFEAVERLSQECGELKRLMAILSDRACIDLAACQPELAMRRLQRSLAITREEGWTQNEAIVLLNLASTHIEICQWDEAYQALVASLAIRRKLVDVAGLAIVLPAMGCVCVVLGRAAEARGYLDEAVEVCLQVGNEVDRWFALLARSTLHLTEGAVRPALRDAVAAARICSPVRHYETAVTLRLLAAVTQAAGRDRWPVEFRYRGDIAYAALTSRKIPDVETMLQRASAAAAAIAHA